MTEKIANKVIHDDRQQFSKSEVVELVWETYNGTKISSRDKKRSQKAEKIYRMLEYDYSNRDYFFFPQLKEDINLLYPKIKEQTIRHCLMTLIRDEKMFSERVTFPKKNRQRYADKVYSAKEFDYDLLLQVERENDCIIPEAVLKRYNR
jgi:hypothetical protein